MERTGARAVALRALSIHSFTVAGGVALFVVFLAFAIFARALLVSAGERRWSVTLAFALALAAVVPSVLCRSLENLVASTWVSAAFAVVGALIFRKTIAIRPLSARLPHTFSIAVAALGTALVIWAAIRGYWWDEHSAHFGLANVIARGVVPPEHPLFPGEPFRYHYAFDVLAGELRAFTGFGVARAIDVVTIVCYLLLLLLSSAVGETLAGRMGASLAIVVTSLGSGALQIFLFQDMGPSALRWNLLPVEWQISMPPPVISNFFQHPQGLGMPLALAVLLLFDRSHENRRRAVAFGGALLGMLSLAQVVFFAVIGAALFLRSVLSVVCSRSVRPWIFELMSLGGAFVLAVALGGFFTPGASMERMLILGRGYFAEAPLRSFAHHLAIFGVPLLAFPVVAVGVLTGHRGRTPLRVALIIAVVVAFVVPNLMSYARSWDIVKFFGVGAFLMNIVLADAVAPVAERRGAVWRVATVLIVVLSTAASWMWVARMGAFDGRVGIPSMHFPPPSRMSELVAERLSPKVQPRERVLSPSFDLYQGSGFLTPGFDWRAFGDSYMLDRTHFDELLDRKKHANLHLRPADLAALGVSWAVLSPWDLGALSAEGRKNLADLELFRHEFDVATENDKRSVYRILTPTPRTSSPSP